MKYCSEGSTSNLVGKADEQAIWKFIHDVAAGLNYLHSQAVPVIHQDIKPANILVDESGNYLITDFGISHKLRSTLRKQSKRVVVSGAISYMGPERFLAEPMTVKASDIWSLGASIYELATGELPFVGQGGGMLNAGAQIPSLDKDKFSSKLNELMQACLAKDTWDRPTADTIERQARAVLDGDGVIIDSFPPKSRSSRKWLWISLIVVALAALGTGVWFAFGDEIKGMVDTESKASENEDTGVKELSDNIKMRMAIVSNNLSIGTNSDFAPLVEARCQYDTIKSIIKENPSLNDEFEDELAELERKLEENLISASEAWINQANILFADGFDDDTAIGYLQYAAAINPSGEALGLLAKKGVEVALCKLSIKGDKMSIVCTPTGKNVDTTLKYTIYDKNFNAKCAGTFPVSISDNKAERINVRLPDAIEDGPCYVYFANADDKNIAYLELK